MCSQAVKNHGRPTLSYSSSLPTEGEAQLSVRRGAVDVWGFDLRHFESEFERFRSGLKPDELARATRFRFEKDRRAFVLRHGVLRQMLGAYLGLAPGQVEFVLGDHGKPRLSNPYSDRLVFSLSVSWPLVLLAFSPTQAVGVDVEQIRPMEDAPGIAQAHFTPNEQAAIRSAPTDAAQAQFFRLWTRKEALLKALGAGFSLPLSSFDVLDRPKTAPSSGAGAPALASWSLVDLDAGPGFAAALCLPEGWGIDLRSHLTPP